MELSVYAGQVHAPHEPADFVPPPRFAEGTFERYRIDASIAGQAEAVARIRGFAMAGRPRFWDWGRRKERQGLYLDGDFGVGKTHLLAASWYAAAGNRRYLSFSETMSLAVLLGPQGCVDLLAADLVCIDEFELDDPSNTRLADLVLEGLFARGSRVMMTSNTVPGDLGAEHQFVQLLRRQLQRVQERFDDVHVPGEDYRQRFRDAAGDDPAGWGNSVDPLPECPVITANELDRLLRDIPVVSLRRLAKSLPGLTITDVDTITDQLMAIRFVHLVDRLYDWRVPTRIRAQCPIAALFHVDYCDLGYRKKYRRCQSRLTELCAEGVPHA